MYKKNVFFVASLILLATLVSANVEMFVAKDIVIIGETVKVERQFAFPQISTFKPFFYIPPTATNLKIISIEENKTLDFDRYSKNNQEEIQIYFRFVCSSDDEGWIPEDGGWLIQQGNYTIETKGGYCDNYQRIIPTESEDIVLLNYSGLRIPLAFILVSYDLGKNPLNNVHCDYKTNYNKQITYVLPEDAWFWSTTEEIPAQFDNNEIVSLDIDYSLINNSRVCFSYGTKSEYASYDSSKNTLLGFYLAFALAIIGIFIGFLYSSYSKNKNNQKEIHLLFIVTNIILLLLFIIFAPKYLSRIVPPIVYTYREWIIIFGVVSIILYLLSLLTLRLVFKKCSICNKFMKKSGIKEHISKYHNDSKSPR